MKKQITLLSGLLLLSGITFAQTNKVKANLSVIEASTTISPAIGGIKEKPSNSNKALGATLWSSDFSDATDWTIGTSGQGTFVIGTTTALNANVGTMTSPTAANGYAYFNGIQFLTPNTIAAPQNSHVQSEVLDCSNNNYVEVSFHQMYRRFNSDSVFVEFSNNGGTTWQSTRLNTEAVGNGATLQNARSVIFLADSTTNGLLRFRWFNASTQVQFGSGYGWCIDDVNVRGLADVDLATINSQYHMNGYRYTRVPSTQVQPINFWSLVKNQGVNSITNLKLNVDVNGTPVASTGTTLTSMNQDTLDVTYTLPATVGTYTMTPSYLMDQTDDVTTNNSFPAASLAVTENTYAIDAGANFTEFPLTSLSVGGVDVVIDGVGMTFDMVNNQEIHAIDFRFHNGTQIGAEVYGEVYELDNGEGVALADLFGSAPLAETEFFTVTALSQVGQMQTLKFAEGYELEAGKTYLVLIRFTSGTDLIKISAAGPSTAAQAWIRGDHANRWGTYSVAPVVRANFDGSLSIDNNSEVVSGVSVFPNPATDKVAVSFNAASASDVTVEVVDVNGKMMDVKTLSNVTVGTNNVDFNTANYAAGIYTVSIKSDASSVTKKLVIR